MKPLLRPGTSVVRRSARALQIGTVAGAALVVADRQGVAAVLRGADGTRDLDTIAATSQLPRAVVAQAAASLLEAGALLDARTWDDVGGAALMGEARALAACGESREQVADRLRARSAAPVEIVGDRLTEDLARRLGQILGEAGADLVGTIGAQGAPALVVVMSAGPSPREAFDVLTGEGVAHLPVVCEADRVRVGPLVRPGLTPCVRCDDVDRAGYEPTWPFVLEQLARPIAQAPATHPHALDTLTGYGVAVHLAGLVLAFCDGRPSAAEGAVQVLGPGVQVGAVTAVALQPDCPCQILTAGEGFDPRVRVARGVRMTA
ncbi:hypothetical protein [Mumia sp.]|uniref:hypothetical protein n=1 Tax=Mumia sp. TaxID=1965300 RepID=UPI00261718CA|nr:hypothetical protein [Mumia sp.]MDD9348608.1 hypothetical protein [Mumia sp.]